MKGSTVIVVIALAVVAYFLWRQYQAGQQTTAGSTTSNPSALQDMGSGIALPTGVGLNPVTGIAGTMTAAQIQAAINNLIGSNYVPLFGLVGTYQ